MQSAGVCSPLIIFSVLFVLTFVTGPSTFFGPLSAVEGADTSYFRLKNRDEKTQSLETQVGDKSRGTGNKTKFFGRRKTTGKHNSESDEEYELEQELGDLADLPDSLLMEEEGDFPVVKTDPSSSHEITVNKIAPGTEPVSLLNARESMWGVFRPGSWIRMQTTGISNDGNGNVKSVTETKLTLLSIESDGVTLQREVTVKMGFVNHAKPTEIVRYDFFGIPITPDQNAVSLSPTSVSIARKVIPCQVRQVERRTGQRREETTLWYSPAVTPYVLQRETKAYDVGMQTGTETLLWRSVMTCSKTSANVLLGNNLIAWRSQTDIQKGNSVCTIKTIHSMRIPGGVVKETTTETDLSGKILYFSNTVLLDYFASRW